MHNTVPSMKGIVILFLLFSCFFISYVHTRRVIRAASDAAKTGCYIVALNKSISHTQFEEIEKEIVKESSDSHIYAEVDSDIAKIVTVRLSGDGIEKVRNGFANINPCIFVMLLSFSYTG